MLLSSVTYFVVVVALQLGAIFLWVYVYNIVRISLEANSVDMNGSAISDSASETSTLKPDSVTEPLLLPKEYDTSEDLPYTIFDGKSKVHYCFFTSCSFIFVILMDLFVRPVLPPFTFYIFFYFILPSLYNGCFCSRDLLKN